LTNSERSCLNSIVVWMRWYFASYALGWIFYPAGVRPYRYHGHNCYPYIALLRHCYVITSVSNINCSRCGTHRGEPMG